MKVAIKSTKKYALVVDDMTDEEFAFLREALYDYWVKLGKQPEFERNYHEERFFREITDSLYGK